MNVYKIFQLKPVEIERHFPDPMGSEFVLETVVDDDLTDHWKTEKDANETLKEQFNNGSMDANRDYVVLKVVNAL